MGSSLRITTGGLFRQYRTNLYGSTNKLSDAMTRVETHRKLNSYAEDPAAASQAWQRRRALWRTNDQINNNSYIFSKYQMAYSAMQELVDGNDSNPGLDGIAESLRGLNGADASARNILGQDLASTAEAIIHTMNGTYGTDFIFAGNDGLNVPFSWGENGEVLYRGIDVNNPLLVPIKGTNVMEVQALKTQGDFQADDGTADVTAYTDYLKQITGLEEEDDLTTLETAAQKKLEEANKLKEMSEEATYSDIGIGFREGTDGQIVPTSAFNTALSGLNIIGFGVDEDGDSMNMAVLMNELAELFNNADPETGAYSDDPAEAEELAKRADTLVLKLRDSISRVQEQHAALASRAEYLVSNADQLDENAAALNEQVTELEDVDPADAITDMLYAQYCYNAALRIGTDILSQSLIDYMN